MVETIPTANQRALCWWFLKLPWREKIKVPSERAMKTESETGVKSDTPFCSRLPIKKTNGVYIPPTKALRLVFGNLMSMFVELFITAVLLEMTNLPHIV